MGIPWWSSGLDSSLSLPGPQFPSLVGELRSQKPRGMAKQNETIKSSLSQITPTLAEVQAEVPALKQETEHASPTTPPPCL